VDERFVSVQKRSDSLEGLQKVKEIELSTYDEGTTWRRSSGMRAKGEGWFDQKFQLRIFNKRRELIKGVLNKLVESRTKLDEGPT